jgi:hypothetical protein
MLVNRMVYAHGVDGKAKLFGMPLPLFIFYLLTLVISLYIGIGLNDHIGLFHALRLLSPSIIIGWVAGLLDWYLFSSRETYYYSEATERANMTAEGINERDIETVIQVFRDDGLFDPDK